MIVVHTRRPSQHLSLTADQISWKYTCIFYSYALQLPTQIRESWEQTFGELGTRTELDPFFSFLQIFFDDMDIFDDYCVVYERLKTVPQIRIVPLDKLEDQYVVQVRKISRKMC